MEEERKLNLAEKGKFEKIAREDIENGVLKYELKRSNEKSDLKERLTKNPPSDIKRLAVGYKVACESKEKYEKAISDKGWLAGNITKSEPHGVEPCTSSWRKREQHPGLKAFDEETNKVVTELKDLARKLIVGLYLSGTQASKLLVEIGDAIKKALK